MLMPCSFLSCVDVWDGYPKLRRRARLREMLVQDCRGRKHVSPTLANILHNEHVLRPITQHMASTGHILKTKRLLHEAVWHFYCSQTESDAAEDPVAKCKKVSVAAKSVKAIKKMLTAIKRKWSRWEMPRVPFLKLDVFQ